MFDSEFLKHLLKLLPDLALILLFGLEMFLLPFHDFAEYSTSFPWCHSRETQILIPVYPNVIFNIPYTVHAVVCVGLWSGQTWGGCSCSGFTDWLHQSKQFGMVGECPIFTAGECAGFYACILLPVLFPLLPVLCRGTASKDVSALERRHLIQKFCFWKGISLQN